MKYELVLVEWCDAETPDTDWLDTEDALREASKPLDTCTSVGFLFYQGEDHITLCHTDGVDQYKLAIKIPTKWILRMKKI